MLSSDEMTRTKKQHSNCIHVFSKSQKIINRRPATLFVSNATLLFLNYSSRLHYQVYLRNVCLSIVFLIFTKKTEHVFVTNVCFFLLTMI